MRKARDLNACIAELQAIHGRDDIDPEQKRDVEVAIEEIKRLKRKSHPSRAEVHQSVREVAARLIHAFVRER